MACLLKMVHFAAVADTDSRLSCMHADGTPFAVWRCLLARDKDKDKEAAWQADAADQHKAMLQVYNTGSACCHAEGSMGPCNVQHIHTDTAAEGHKITQ